MTEAILVIDDDLAISKIIKKMLDGAGYAVTCIVDGKQAMRAIRACRPDLVITDLIMPNQEGIETIMQLRQYDPTVPIIAMSGGGRLGNFDFLEMAQSLGATATLAKPFGSAALLDKVRACLTH